MPWAGGTFNLLYNWLADRDTGIKIRADKMMGQEQDLADGMEQTLLRNGVNSPTADIDWGGHFITNYGDGPGTVTTREELEAAVRFGSWVLWNKGPPFTVAYASGNSVLVGPGDQSPIFHPGRRIKVQSGLVLYATVKSTSVAVPGTTVVFETDTGQSIGGTVDFLHYGVQEFTNPAYLPPRTCVRAQNSGDQGLPNGPSTKITLDDQNIDTLG